MSVAKTLQKRESMAPGASPDLSSFEAGSFCCHHNDQFLRALREAIERH